MILRIQNLEGQQNFVIGLKVTTILPMFFFFLKKIKRRHVGCLSRGNKLEYCAAHSDFLLSECILSEILKKDFETQKNCKIGPFS